MNEKKVIMPSKYRLDDKNTVSRNATKTPHPLTPKQARAVTLLAEGKTAQDTATQLGIDEGELATWQQAAPFEAALNKRHAEQLAASARRLRHLQATAIDTIENILGDAEAPAPARLSAALAVLKLADVGREVSRAPGHTTADEVERQRFKDEMFSSVFD